MNINLCIIGGNITKDAELRYSQSGTAIANFAVAVNERWKDKEGNQKEKATFINCKAFGKTAENIALYFKKGSRFYGHGKIDVESWDDQRSGQKHYKTVVQIESFQFCERGERQEQAELPPRQRPAVNKPAEDPNWMSDDSDNIPY